MSKTKFIWLTAIGVLFFLAAFSFVTSADEFVEDEFVENEFVEDELVKIDDGVKQFDYVCIKEGADHYIGNMATVDNYEVFTALKFETLINGYCFALNYKKFDVVFLDEYFEEAYPQVDLVVKIMTVKFVKYPENLTANAAEALKDKNIYVILYRQATQDDYERLGQGI